MSEVAASRNSTTRWIYLIVMQFVALFLCLVLMFQFQMNAFVAIRAFVGGEGLWAKAQKEAVHSIEHYAVSRDEADYQLYLRQIQVPLGDYTARIELQKDSPDMAVARAALLQGRNHPVDIEYVIPFFRRFQHTVYMTRVIRHWTDGDNMVVELNGIAGALHDEIVSGRNHPGTIRNYLARLDDINRQVAVEEDMFSSTLAEASRWANEVSRTLTYAIALLFVALGIGLSLPIIRRIRRTEKDLHAAQEELLRKEKLAVLGQVAGSVGHELRNPLGVMSNAVYFLQTVLADADETTREYLDIIRDEIGIAERIVNDLLDSVRTKPPHPEAVGIRELVELTLRKYIVPASVSVKLDIPESLPPLKVDAQQIHQVFRNLISNGVEAMPDGGALEISALENKPAGNVTIRVRDSGIGMTEEQMGHLFQPLFTTKARGIGLGLMVVKNLTQANGGIIAVQSVIGQGTTFSVTLPVDHTSGAEG